MPKKGQKVTKTKKSKVLAKKTQPKSRSVSTKNSQLLPFDAKPIKHKLLSPWSLTIRSLIFIWENRNIFFFIILIYGLANFFLAKGFSIGGNAGVFKSQAESLFSGNYKQFESSFAVFGLLLGSLASTNQTNGGDPGFLLILLVIVSLAIIWTIRTRSKGLLVKARDAYYYGIYPLISFVLILFLISIELLPMIAGIYIYILATSNGIVTGAVEDLIFSVIAVLASLGSLYLVANSFIALYIATLPNMTPLKALRSSKNLVKKNRIAIIIRLIYLPIVLTFIAALVVVPVIAIYAPASAYVLLVISYFIIVFIHNYMYQLYRDLLK